MMHRPIWSLTRTYVGLILGLRTLPIVYAQRRQNTGVHCKNVVAIVFHSRTLWAKRLGERKKHNQILSTFFSVNKQVLRTEYFLQHFDIVQVGKSHNA
jgi:hypothetical protein